MRVSELTALVGKLKPPFFEGMAPVAVASMVAVANQQHYQANSIVTNQGHASSHVYMVLSGQARSYFVTQGGQKLHIHWYPPGEMFGGMALVSKPSPYVVSTECTRNSHLLLWERRRIRALVTQYPQLLDNALTIASNYVNAAIAAQVSLSFHTASQRLALVLMNLASGIGHKVARGVEVTAKNEELAAAAGITPFTASRIIGEWARTGLVSKSRGKILITSPEQLVLQEI